MAAKKTKHPDMACNHPEVLRAADLARRLYPGLRERIGDNPRLWREIAWKLHWLNASRDDHLGIDVGELFEEAERDEARLAAMPGRDRPIKRNGWRLADRLAERLVSRMDD